MAERLVRLEDRIGVLDRAVHRVAAELGPGLPEPDEREGRNNVRTRLHILENDKHAERIAQAAMTKARQAKAREWTNGQKAGLFLFAAVAAVTSVLRMIGIG